MRFRVCSLFKSFSNDRLINLRSGGALRWKVKTISWEGRKVVCGKLTPPRW
jgi:hypothetical protein